MKINGKYGMYLCAAAATVVMGACASMGRPEGGARDETPPEFVRSVPAPGALNVSRTRLDAWFDENIEMDDAFNKVIVSPAQQQAPVVRSLGKHLYVELRDTLIPNTTYTIDFADAIKDLNEGNILDGFALDFSTGPTIDTLRISGMVFQASNLEPAQGMTVGVFREPADTTLATMPFERIARTNQYGQFTVRNLKPGKYAVYAINDVNRDHRWDRSEDIAFLGELVSPSVKAITVSDTLRNADDTADSIVTRPGVSYLPDDVLLTWFNEGYRAQYLKDYKRPERRRLSLVFGAPTDTMPTITAVGGPFDGRRIEPMTLMTRSASGDSLGMWIADTLLSRIDSLQLAVRHPALDSLERKIWVTDTLRFFWRDQKVKEKKKKDDDTIPAPTPMMELQIAGKQQHNVYEPLQLTAGTPIAAVDTTAFHLEYTTDSIWHAAKFALPIPARAVPVSNLATSSWSPQTKDDAPNAPPLPIRMAYGDSAPVLWAAKSDYTVPAGAVADSVPYTVDGTVIATAAEGLRIDFDLRPGVKYRFTVDSLAITDIYGLHNKALSHEFTVRTIEEYANLVFKITGPDTVTTYGVELLNENDQPVRTATVRTPVKMGADSVAVAAGPTVVEFRNLDPGTYYARLYIDANANGRWDTGNVGAALQPEEVYYYPKKIDLRANWDVENPWAIYDTPLDRQKPAKIKKNKPKLKKGQEQPNDDEQLYDEWGDPIDSNDPAYRNRNRTGNTNLNNLNNRGGGFGGGLQQAGGNTGTLRR